MIKRLFIIGNGFDISHKLKTSYDDFEKWISNRDKELYSKPVVLVNFNILKNISKFHQNVVVLDLIEHCKPVICFQIYSLAL